MPSLYHHHTIKLYCVTCCRGYDTNSHTVQWYTAITYHFAIDFHFTIFWTHYHTICSIPLSHDYSVIKCHNTIVRDVIISLWFSMIAMITMLSIMFAPLLPSLLVSTIKPPSMIWFNGSANEVLTPQLFVQLGNWMFWSLGIVFLQNYQTNPDFFFVGFHYYPYYHVLHHHGRHIKLQRCITMDSSLTNQTIKQANKWIVTSKNGLNWILFTTIIPCFPINPRLIVFPTQPQYDITNQPIHPWKFLFNSC
jgi:hypothetical protein